MINENIEPSPTWNSIETANELYEGSVILTTVSDDHLPAINGAAELHSTLGKIF